MKYKISVLILTIAIAAVLGSLVSFIFGEKLEEWSIRFAIGTIFAALGWMWGQGKFSNMKKEELITVVAVTAAYLYFLSAFAILILILLPALLIAFFLCGKFLQD